MALGTATIVNYSWNVQYFYVNGVTLSQSGSNPQFSFTAMCGGTGSTDDGALQSLQVILTVTDSSGNSATASSGSGSQPPLFLRLYTCGL